MSEHCNEKMALEPLVIELSQLLLQKQQRLAVAESCTGGWLSKILTDLPGSSEWFDCGFVTYSNAAKSQMLGVSPTIIEKHGAVSEAVVLEMVKGIFTHSHASVAMAISGIAGPSGGTENKPVGTVWLAWGLKEQTILRALNIFMGDREAVRYQSIRTALHLLIALLKTQ